MFTAIHPQFLEDYKDTLVLDKEGVPTIESILNNEYIQGMINQDEMAGIQSQEYSEVDDTLENYETVLEKANVFNTSSKQNDRFVAVLQRNDNGKIQVAIKPRTEEWVNKFNNDYSTLKLNQRLE